MFEYISIFGPPKELLSDQGKEFLNEVVNNLSKVIGIERRVTSPYHPQTNGLTEKFNHILVNSLRKFVEDDTKMLHKWIPFVLLSYRTKIHTRTNYTPFELMFGRRMNNFENWACDDISKEIKSINNRSTEIRKLVELHGDAAKNIAASKSAQMESQNNAQNVVKELIPIGTKVYVQALGLLNKLDAKYHGPYVVSGYTRLKNYWLKNR